MPLQRPRCGPRPQRPPGHQGRRRRHLVPGLGRGRAPRPLGAPALRGPQRLPPRTSAWPSAFSMAAWSGASRKLAEPLIEKARAAWRDAARHPVPADARDPDGRAPRHRRRRRLPARARPEGEPRRAARRQRAAGHLRLRAAAGRLRRPGVARRTPPRCSPTIRVELHRMARREHDRLLLQDQDQVADALGFADADALMLAVSTAGRQIAWVSDDVWRRRQLWDPTPPPQAPLPTRRTRRRRHPSPRRPRSRHGARSTARSR